MKYVCMCEPMGKPRMTQRDKWMKRKCVVQYRRYADELKKSLCGDDVSDCGVIYFTAYISFPKSYSKEKRINFQGSPHRIKPDIDNIGKGILDALFDDDSGVWSCHGRKFWDDGNGARIELEVYP